MRARDLLLYGRQREAAYQAQRLMRSASLLTSTLTRAPHLRRSVDTYLASHPELSPGRCCRECGRGICFCSRPQRGNFPSGRLQTRLAKTESARHSEQTLNDPLSRPHSCYRGLFLLPASKQPGRRANARSRLGERATGAKGEIGAWEHDGQPRGFRQPGIRLPFASARAV